MPAIESFMGFPYANVDEVGLSDVSPEMYNGYVDEAKMRHMRPGLLEFVDLGIGYPVTGLYWWETARRVLAVCNGRIWEITDALGTNAELSGATLSGTQNRVSFADAGLTGQYCAMANGGKIVYVEGSVLHELADADAPQNVTHLAFMDQYVLANSYGTGYVYWSDVNDLTSWTALSFASAESKPDNVVAISAEYNELYLVGSKSIEVYYNDGSSPFSRLPGATSPRGIIAPHSWQFADNTWIGLDQEHHIMMLNGRSPVVVSTPLDRLLQGYDSVANATGDVIDIAGRSFYVLTIPDEAVTLVFDIAARSFVGKWSWWNLQDATHEQWRGGCYCYAKDWNLHLVGDRSTGKIYKMSTDYCNDNGDIIRHSQRTGHVDHGTGKRKRSSLVRFKMKRGSGITGSEITPPQVSLRWRNQGAGDWSNERILSLGAVGDTNIYAETRQLGMYRARQYELVYTDDAPMTLAGAEEEVEVLAR